VRNFTAISWREQDTFRQYDDDVRFVQDPHAILVRLYSASSLKQQSADRNYEGEI
jgi:hypothetical protein